jgi:hypothetical protein
MAVKTIKSRNGTKKQKPVVPRKLEKGVPVIYQNKSFSWSTGIVSKVENGQVHLWVGRQVNGDPMFRTVAEKDLVEHTYEVPDYNPQFSVHPLPRQMPSAQPSVAA